MITRDNVLAASQPHDLRGQFVGGHNIGGGQVPSPQLTLAEFLQK